MPLSFFSFFFFPTTGPRGYVSTCPCPCRLAANSIHSITHRQTETRDRDSRSKTRHHTSKNHRKIIPPLSYTLNFQFQHWFQSLDPTNPARPNAKPNQTVRSISKQATPVYHQTLTRARAARAKRASFAGGPRRAAW